MKRRTKIQIKTTIYFRSQRKSRILMLNINENCRNRRRKRSNFDVVHSETDKKRYVQRRSVDNLLWEQIRDKNSRFNRLPPMFSIILPLFFLLTLTTTTQITSRVYAQKVSLAHHQASVSSNDDEELSKTMNGIGDEELNLNNPATATTTSSSSTVQPQLSPLSSPFDRNHDNRNEEGQESQQQQQRNGHSIKSIWSPTDGHQDESLGSSADLMRQPKGDEEFAGQAEPSELNRQFISVLNNQSDIIFNNNTRHESMGNELQHATTFLLGKTIPSSLTTSSQTLSSGQQQNSNNDNNNNNDYNNNNNNFNNNDNEHTNETRLNLGNESTLLGARFNEALFTSPSSVRMVQFESQSNVTGSGSNRVESLATSTSQPTSQLEQTTSSSSGGSSRSSGTNNFTPTAIIVTKQRAHVDSKLGKKRKKERPTVIKGYIKQNKSNKGLNNGNAGYAGSNNSNHLGSTNSSSADIGAKMISYSLVPSATTTNRPKFGPFSLLSKQDLEGQIMLAATSSPIRSIVMPNKLQQQQQHQQISPPASNTPNRNVALIFPNGGGTTGGGISSVGNQIKLQTASSPPDGRYLAAAAAAAAQTAQTTAALTDQFGSSSLVSPPVINNSKESFIFDSKPSNNLVQKQQSTNSGTVRNIIDGTTSTSTSSSGSSSSSSFTQLSHLFPSSTSSSSFASPSASTILTAASTPSSASIGVSVGSSPTATKSTSYPLSVIDPATRASLFEQLRRSPLLANKVTSGGGAHTKQSLSLNEFLITSSSSHQPNEFETTLKQQPDQQHEPIVQIQDQGSSSIPIALEANSSELSPVSPSASSHHQQQQPNASSSPDDMSDDDEGADNDTNESFEMTHSGDFELKNEPVNGQDQDGKPTRLDIKSQQQQLANDQSQAQNHHQQQHQKPINADTELLVGPFKSESEAPATITLSGVVYQKSGASSSFLRPTTKPEANDKENLSTSGSQQASASSTAATTATSNNINNSVMQLKPNSSYRIFDSSQLKGLKLEDLINQSSDKNWPYLSSQSNLFQTPFTTTNSNGNNHHQLGSINEILLGSIKSAGGEPTMSMEPAIKDSTPGLGSSLFSSLQLPDSYMGLTGGIRLGPFPFSPASLLSNSLFGSGSNHLLDDLTAQKVMKGGLIEQQASTLSTDHAPLWGSATTSTASSSSSPTSTSLGTSSSSTTTGKLNGNKLAESYYLGSLNTAPSDNHYHSKQKDKGPIVIVQKDVKPVKYHLMRAYLKLRRLLRPFEATYVFLNDRHSFVKRRQIARQMALKVPQRRKSIAPSLILPAKRQQPEILETSPVPGLVGKTTSSNIEGSKMLQKQD